MRLRLHDLGALLGVGRKLGTRAGLLRPCDVGGTASLVEARRAEETPRHQRLRPLQIGQCSRQHRIGLRHRGLRRTPPGAAQPRQSGSGLALAGLRLRQRGPQFVGFQADQDFTLPHLRPFVHRHHQYATGQRTADVHSRERGHPRRELQRTYQWGDLHGHRGHSRRAGQPPGEQGSGEDGDSGEDKE